jgi:hypothetical protein
MTDDPSLTLNRGRRVLATEAAAVAALEQRLDASFEREEEDRL